MTHLTTPNEDILSICCDTEDEKSHCRPDSFQNLLVNVCVNT